MKRTLFRIADLLGLARSEDGQLFVQIFRRYFPRFKWQLAIIAVLIGVISATTATVALLVETIVDQLFVEKNAGLIGPLMLAVLVVFTTKGLSAYFQGVLSARIANAIIADVQKRLFAHLLHQRMRFYVRHASDALLMRFVQGAEGFGAILTLVMIQGVRDVATVVALIAVMLYQDPLLSVLSLIVSPVIFIGVARLVRKVKVQAEQELAGHAELNKRVREVVQGIAVIKSFRLEDAARDRAEQVVDNLQERRNRIAALQVATNPLLDTIGGIAVSVAVMYGGIRTISGAYDAGTFMSFVTALLLAADPARRLSQMRVQLRNAFVAVRNVFDLLADDDPEPSGASTLPAGLAGAADGAGPLPPSIQFDDVSFRYDDAGPVLDRFCLDVEPGETIALVGPSGAGKSTVFRLLLRFYEPTSGTIRLGGADLSTIDPDAVRRMVSYVGQSNFMFDGSIRDNLSLMDPSVEEAAIRAACAKVGLDGFIDGLADGYDTPVGELGTMISGGQAQRLNLARALIEDLPVLLLDEVTSALDAESENRIKQILKDMARSKTILVIAHRLSTVRDADRIALVHEGRVVDTASHDELLRRNAEYEKIVSLQLV